MEALAPNTEYKIDDAICEEKIMFTSFRIQRRFPIILGTSGG